VGRERRKLSKSKSPKRLVPVDRARLKKLIADDRRPQAQIAAAVGILPTKLTKLLHGANEKCPTRVRRALARELGASEAYLSGAPLAPPPGIHEAEYELLVSSRDPKLRRHIDDVAGRVGTTPDPRFAPPLGLSPGTEIEVVRTYRAIRSAIEMSDYEAAVLLRELPDLMDIGFWRRFLHEDLESGSVTDDEREQFAAAMGHVIRLLLAPYGRDTPFGSVDTRATSIFTYMTETVFEILKATFFGAARLQARTRAYVPDATRPRAHVLTMITDELRARRDNALFQITKRKAPTAE